MSLEVCIKKHFKDFSLDVAFTSDGGPLGILGVSGSGKSMTLKCIAGLETPDEGYIISGGQVLYDSKKKINIRPQKRRVGYLFQDYALFPHMTVAENIACAVEDKNARKQTIEHLISRFELDGLAGRYPLQLSGGQQQRAALARILAYQPRALLLDEPFAALDSHLKEALQLDMIELLKEYDGDAVLVTHDRDEAYKLCENLLVLDDGAVSAMGGTHNMFQNPHSLVAARLTGCKNFSRAKKLSDTSLQAVDWGVTLAAAAVPDDITHIGIRAHYFTPCAATAQNAIAVTHEKTVESPFEWNLLFRAAAGGEEAAIWWKVAKTDEALQIPTHLAIAPESIHLLVGA